MTDDLLLVYLDRRKLPEAVDDAKRRRGLVRLAASCADLDAFRNAVTPSGWNVGGTITIATCFGALRDDLGILAVNLDLPLCVFLLDASETNYRGFRDAIDQARQRWREIQWQVRGLRGRLRYVLFGIRLLPLEEEGPLPAGRRRRVCSAKSPKEAPREEEGFRYSLGAAASSDVKQSGPLPADAPQDRTRER